MNYKLVFLGEQGCGKTSIISRYIYNSFDEVYQATIGIDFLAKSVNLNDRVIKLQLWDTAGQERFRSLISSYIRDCSGAIVVYDLTNRVSFNDVDAWIERIRAEHGDNVVVVLVANKLDCETERQVSAEEGRQKAAQFGALFFETSAKTGENVANLFNTICKQLPVFNENSPSASALELGLDAPSGKNRNILKFCNC